MSKTLERMALELKRSRERNLYLEESNLRYVGILDMLASSSDFQADLNHRDSASIYRTTFQQVKRLLPLHKMAFYANTDDNDFELTECDPPDCREVMEREVSAKIMDGSFAWAINQNRPVLVPSDGGEQTLILHVLATQTRIRGMFVGLLRGNQVTIDAPSLNALSIILINTAYAHESATLYAMLSDHMYNLEQKVAERTHELQKARQQAELANQSKSSFLATMSHELRTPLNAAIGFTDVVLSKSFGPLNAEQEEYLGYVFQSSKHLLELINDILDLSKVEADKMELDPADVTIRNLLGNSMIMVKELAHRRELQLSDEFAPDVPVTIRADERKLKQIFFNLLSNAIKFTPVGGTITVALRKGVCIFDMPPAIGRQLADAGAENRDYLMISITDTGIGLKLEDLERIFNPFEQADNSSTREFEGTGLGLALTRKLLELHGGAIWADSAGPGRGSTFRFVLPL